MNLIFMAFQIIYTTPQAQGYTQIAYANPQASSITYANQPASSTLAYANQPAGSTVTYANQPSASTIAYGPAVTYASYNPNLYSPQSQLTSAASFYQGQIVPYTAASSANNVVLSPAQLQQISYSQPAVAAYAPIPAAYSTPSPFLPKVGSTVTTPTASAYYSAPFNQHYNQQPPSFCKYIC